MNQNLAKAVREIVDSLKDEDLEIRIRYEIVKEDSEVSEWLEKYRTFSADNIDSILEKIFDENGKIKKYKVRLQLNCQTISVKSLPTYAISVYIFDGKIRDKYMKKYVKIYEIAKKYGIYEERK